MPSPQRNLLGSEDGWDWETISKSEGKKQNTLLGSISRGLTVCSRFVCVWYMAAHYLTSDLILHCWISSPNMWPQFWSWAEQLLHQHTSAATYCWLCSWCSGTLAERPLLKIKLIRRTVDLSGERSAGVAMTLTDIPHLDVLVQNANKKKKKKMKWRERLKERERKVGHRFSHLSKWKCIHGVELEVWFAFNHISTLCQPWVTLSPHPPQKFLSSFYGCQTWHGNCSANYDSHNVIRGCVW